MIPEFVFKDLGEDIARLRLEREENYFATGQPKTGHFAECVLRKSGLWNWAHRKAWDIRFCENEFYIKDLPLALEGFRILHLSDFHLGFDSRGLNPELEKLLDLEYDLLVFTGDLMDRNGDLERGWKEWGKLSQWLKKPIYAVPGNHDSMDVLDRLHEEGVVWLLNQSLEIEFSGVRLCLAGIDDRHHFKTANIKQALERLPVEEFSLFLSHVPCVADDLKGRNVLQLCGHTHGGQVCMPFGIPFFRNGTLSLKMMAGQWMHGNMSAYTSRGIGNSGVSARSFCPPEVVSHVLRRVLA